MSTETPKARRPIRSGVQLVIAGMVSIPVSIFSAQDTDSDGDLTNVCTAEAHADRPSTIRQVYRCPICEVESGFVKGKKVDDGLVVIPKEIIEKAEAATAELKGSIQMSVHDATEVNQMMPSGKSYYLTAKAGPAAESYVALAKLMEQRPDLTFVGQHAMKGGPAPYQLIVADGTLVLRQMARPDLVRERPQVDGDVSELKVQQFSAVLDMLKTNYDPTSFLSERSKVLTEYVSQQAPQAPAAAPGTVDTSITSLEDQLAAVLAQAQAQSQAAAEPAAPAKPARKRAAKKTTTASALKAVPTKVKASA